MWIFANNAFVSIVQDREDTDMMVVRARIRGDVKRIFPEVKEIETTDSDYRFRAWVSRDRVIEAMTTQIENIDYNNFKSSVTNKKRHDAYLGVWTVMYNYQSRMYGPQDFMYY